MLNALYGMNNVGEKCMMYAWGFWVIMFHTHTHIVQSTAVGRCPLKPAPFTLYNDKYMQQS